MESIMKNISYTPYKEQISSIIQSIVLTDFFIGSRCWSIGRRLVMSRVDFLQIYFCSNLYTTLTLSPWLARMPVILSAGFNRCGVEQWQLVGLITRRSQVQVLPPLLSYNRRPPGSPKQASPAVFGSKSLQKKEIFMNQRPTGLSLSKATVGFLQYKGAMIHALACWVL